MIDRLFFCLRLSFFSFFFFILICEPVAAETRYYTIEREGFPVGYVTAQKEIEADGSVKITETDYLPYDFFPAVVEWKLIVEAKGKKVREFQKVIHLDGDSEKIFLWRGENDLYFYLIDFGRIFYFGKDVKVSPGLTVLDEDSPFLLEEFFKRQAGQISANSKGIKVEYFPSLALRTQPVEAVLEPIPEGGGYRFSGRFEAVLSVSDGKITRIYRPDKSITYTPVDFIPDLTRILNISPENLKKCKIASASYFQDKDLNCIEIPVNFSSYDNVKLAGTLMVPSGNNKPRPGFLLLAGSGPYDRSGGGLIYDLAARLVKNGVVVLIYDKRGAGESEGSYSGACFDDFVKDADSAVNFLASRPEVDSFRIGVLGHSEGALVAARVALENGNVGGLILMASPGVKMFPDMALEQSEQANNFTATRDEEPDISAKSIEIIMNYLKGERLFYDVGKMRLCLEVVGSYYKAPAPLDVMKQIKCPVLLLHGQEDLIVPISHTLNLNAALGKSGNDKVRMLIFSGTDHFFGKFVEPSAASPYRRHIELHKEVLDRISEWVKLYY